MYSEPMIGKVGGPLRAGRRAMVGERPSSFQFCDKLGRRLPAVVVMSVADGGSSLERE
jgi:hypothetical protein